MPTAVLCAYTSEYHLAMPNSAFPSSVDKFFSAKAGGQVEAALACFTEDAKVLDNGEDLELRGIAEIRDWMTSTVAGYKLTSEIKSGEMRGEEFVARVVVSGDFPGSPYEFAYRFTLRGEKIVELAIDPIGSLAP